MASQIRPFVILPDKTALKFLTIFVISVIAATRLPDRRGSIRNIFALGASIIALTALGGAFAHIGRGLFYGVGFATSYLVSAKFASNRSRGDRNDFDVSRNKNPVYQQDDAGSQSRRAY